LAKSKGTEAKQKIPVVTILGHVDHGKTSLLDALRGTDVASGEAGGITQHIRAHSFVYKDRKVTFVDTPGHEAFTQMRSRGGDVADVGVLVVAADDSVKPQTKEAIGILKALKVPFVVAINKMDKEGADIEKVKRDLSIEEVELEGFGGDVPFVGISAKEKTNLDELMEVIFLLADMNAAEVEDTNYGRATVLESNQDKGLGNVALTIVREGKFKRGQLIATTDGISKVRSLMDEYRNQKDEVIAGEPATIVGIENILPVGEVVFSVNSKEEGEKIIGLFKQQLEEIKSEDEAVELSEEDIAGFFTKNKTATDIKKLPILVKTDTKGTLEAVLDSLTSLSDEAAAVEIVQSGVGTISEKEVEFAGTTGAIVVAFNVAVEPSAISYAKDNKIFVKSYKIIYELIDEVSDALDALVKPDKEEKIIGKGKVIAKFTLTDGTLVAGTEVVEDEIKKNKKCYFLRRGERVAEAQITSMRIEKGEVSVATKGNQVGLNVKPQFEFEVGDEIVCYELV
jgi:translation initiation factor IF-2